MKIYAYLEGDEIIQPGDEYGYGAPPVHWHPLGPHSPYLEKTLSSVRAEHQFQCSLQVRRLIPYKPLIVVNHADDTPRS